MVKNSKKKDEDESKNWYTEDDRKKDERDFDEDDYESDDDF